MIKKRDEGELILKILLSLRDIALLITEVNLKIVILEGEVKTLKYKDRRGGV